MPLSFVLPVWGQKPFQWLWNVQKVLCPRAVWPWPGSCRQGSGRRWPLHLSFHLPHSLPHTCGDHMEGTCEEIGATAGPGSDCNNWSQSWLRHGGSVAGGQGARQGFAASSNSPNAGSCSGVTPAEMTGLQGGAVERLLRQGNRALKSRGRK